MKHESLIFITYGAGIAFAALGFGGIFDGKPGGWLAVILGLAVSIAGRYWHEASLKIFARESKQVAMPYPNVCPDCFHEECIELVKAYWLLETARRADHAEGKEWRPLP